MWVPSMMIQSPFHFLDGATYILSMLLMYSNLLFQSNTIKSRDCIICYWKVILHYKEEYSGKNATSYVLQAA